MNGTNSPPCRVNLLGFGFKREDRERRTLKFPCDCLRRVMAQSQSFIATRAQQHVGNNRPTAKRNISQQSIDRSLNEAGNIFSYAFKRLNTRLRQLRSTIGLLTAPRCPSIRPFSLPNSVSYLLGPHTSNSSDESSLLIRVK